MCIYIYTHIYAETNYIPEFYSFVQINLLKIFINMNLLKVD